MLTSTGSQNYPWKQKPTCYGFNYAFAYQINKGWTNDSSSSLSAWLDLELPRRHASVHICEEIVSEVNWDKKNHLNVSSTVLWPGCWSGKAEKGDIQQNVSIHFSLLSDCGHFNLHSFQVMMDCIPTLMGCIPTMMGCISHHDELYPHHDGLYSHHDGLDSHHDEPYPHHHELYPHLMNCIPTIMDCIPANQNPK